MMKNLILTVIFLVASKLSLAQNLHFTTAGSVQFEKTINMFAAMKKMINKDNESYMQQVYDQFKKNQSQFKKLKSTLYFANDKTMFKPNAEDGTQSGFFGSAQATQNNIIRTDLGTCTFIDQKKVFEETFLVKDSIRNINWKITDETRDIAGYTCRRANAVVLDSIYVVAFYTDEIAVSGGPESFAGLPGIILGVALPHENITWFATKVNEITVDPKNFNPPTKGKPVNSKQLRTTLQAALKDWGDYAKESFKALLL